MEAGDRLILALDVDDFASAEGLVCLLSNEISTFKVGSILFTASGPEIVNRIRELGGKVFLDLKWHDIPTTVARACEAAARLGVFMVSVHIAGGGEMMRLSHEVVTNFGPDRPLLLGITVLTSLGAGEGVGEEIIQLAKRAKDSGLDGVVAPGQFVSRIRSVLGNDFLTVVPGIRPAGAGKNDHQKILTPGKAIRNGADYLVVGRPITQAPDPLEAVRSLKREMQDSRIVG